MNMPNKILWPQLAASGKPDVVAKLWDDPNWVAERKIDGSRYLLHIGSEEGYALTSRQASRSDGLPVNKIGNVPHIVETVRNCEFDLGYTVLDGEIQHQDFDKTISVMGSLPDRAIELQKTIGYVDYHIFDILYFKGQFVGGEPLLERRQLLESVYYNHLVSNPHIKLVEQIRNNKEQAFWRYLKEGGEGVVLKNLMGLNIPRKAHDDSHRPNDWIKVKKVLTDDVIIIGAEPPERLYTGKDVNSWMYWETMPTGLQVPVTRWWATNLIGSIVFGKYDDEGRLLVLGKASGITDYVREELSEDRKTIKPEFLGKVIEIMAMEKTKVGAYRHPRFIRFRPDKDATECTMKVRK